MVTVSEEDNVMPYSNDSNDYYCESFDEYDFEANCRKLDCGVLLLSVPILSKALQELVTILNLIL